MIKFCDTCLKDVECTLNKKMTEVEVEGIKVRYLKKYYVCSECNHEFLDDLSDYDTQVVNNELRKNYDIITTDEINEILTKYNIGKKPLSLVLGLGEINIIRYLDGSNPTKEISDLLKSVLNNPFLYELYLQGAKDKIAKVTFKKSLGKTKQLELSEKRSKLYNSTLYIIHSLEETDPLSVQKLLFFANGFAPLFLGRKLFDDNPEAWIHGPVYREIYDCFSYYGRDRIDYNEIIKNVDVVLDDQEKDYLNEIMNDFACYSGSILREMTHMTTPWQEARMDLEDDEYSNRLIDEKDICDYFKKVYDQYKMSYLRDISKYSNDLFRKARKNIWK